MLNIKIKVIAIQRGEIETITKEFRKYLSNVEGKHEKKKLQKTTELALDEATNLS
jgi:hypothetical protein